MDRIFLILILYIIFGVIGPLIKRMQRQRQQLSQKTPPKPVPGERTPQQTGTQQTGTQVEKHYNRLQEVFQQKPSQKVPAPSRRQESKLLSIPPKSVPQEKTALELFPPPLPAKPRVSPSYERPVSRRKHPPAPSPPKKSLLDIDRRRGYMQGIIMAEILGPPVSKRPRPKR